MNWIELKYMNLYYHCMCIDLAFAFFMHLHWICFCVEWGVVVQVQFKCECECGFEVGWMWMRNVHWSYIVFNKDFKFFVLFVFNTWFAWDLYWTHDLHWICIYDMICIDFVLKAFSALNLKWKVIRLASSLDTWFVLNVYRTQHLHFISFLKTWGALSLCRKQMIRI